PSDGTSNLASSPGGAPHAYVWHAGADLGGPLPRSEFFERGAWFQVQVFGALAGNTETTGPCDVLSGARIITPARPRLSSNAATLWGSPVPLRYALTDQASRPLDVVIHFSLDGGATWRSATEAQGAGSEGTVQLASSPYSPSGPSGTAHYFAWNA